MVGSQSEDGRLAGRDQAPAWARLTLDVFERAFVCALFAWLAWSNLIALGAGANWFNLVQVVAEALNVAFILVRKRATAVSYRLSDWVVALGAATGSLLARPAYPFPLGDNSVTALLFAAPSGLQTLGPASLAGSLILVGLMGQVWAKLTLRRSFGLTPANRGLKSSGPYRYVRHPMYLGYLTGWIGFFLLNPTPWNALVYAATLVLQWRRIEAEERVLALDPAHAAYREEVPYRVIPGIW